MWILQSLLAALCFTVMFLLFKQLHNANVSAPVILFWIFLFGTVLYGTHLVLAQENFIRPSSVLAILLAGAVLSYLGNLAQTKAIGTAPNPGFAIAVVSSQSVLTTLLAVYLFGAELGWTKIVGIVVTLLGVALVSL